VRRRHELPERRCERCQRPGQFELRFQLDVPRLGGLQARRQCLFDLAQRLPGLLAFALDRPLQSRLRMRDLCFDGLRSRAEPLLKDTQSLIEPMGLFLEQRVDDTARRVIVRAGHETTFLTKPLGIAFNFDSPGDVFARLIEAAALSLALNRTTLLFGLRRTHGRGSGAPK
jgi:hypothetical protein